MTQEEIYRRQIQEANELGNIPNTERRGEGGKLEHNFAPTPAPGPEATAVEEQPALNLSTGAFSNPAWVQTEVTHDALGHPGTGYRQPSRGTTTKDYCKPFTDSGPTRVKAQPPAPAEAQARPDTCAYCGEQANVSSGAEGLRCLQPGCGKLTRFER
jgi:hypothetical protein